MNNIEILEILSRKIEEQNSIIAACSSIINKKAEAKERTEYIEIKKFVENLIQENKELKEIRDSLLWQKNFDTKILDEDYIPKSKVTQKIQELEYDQLENLKNICEDRIKIQAYKELLEEGE